MPPPKKKFMGTVPCESPPPNEVLPTFNTYTEIVEPTRLILNVPPEPVVPVDVAVEIPLVVTYQVPDPGVLALS